MALNLTLLRLSVYFAVLWWSFKARLDFNNLQKGHEALITFGTLASSTIVEEPTVLLMWSGRGATGISIECNL